MKAYRRITALADGSDSSKMSTPPPKRRFPPQSKVPDINEPILHRKVERTHFFSPAGKWAIVICVLSLLGVIAVNRLTERNLTTNRKPAQMVMANAVESAVNNFFTEYGKLPAAGPKVTTNTPGGIRFLHVLLGLEGAEDGSQNVRRIKFLSVKSGEDKRNGLVYTEDGKSVEGLYDLWGNPYTVELDADGNELLEFQLGSKTVKLTGRLVAVHSPGPDRKSGTSDDVTTW